MKFELSPRPVFAVFAVISVALIGAALAVQYFRGEAPCPLCVLQRAGVVLFGLIALVAAIHRPRRRGAAGYSAALALAALAGLGVAVHHVWVLYHPKFGCGIDALEQIVNDLPTAKLLPWLFHASGDCTASHEPLLGLQVPEWSLVWFGLLLLAAIFYAFKCLSAARAGAAD
jgi:protein dithiol:quinone oxidoreductase